MAAYDAVIIGAHIVTPSGVVDKNIGIDGGCIAYIGADEPACDCRIRADGLVALPGAIDTHVHYGVYSPIGSAAQTESRAAAAGGVTTMMRMLRLGGSYRKNLPAQLEASAASHCIDYAVHASIFDLGQAEEMEYCVQQGITSFKLYMNLGSDIGHVYMDMAPGSSQLEAARVEVGADIVEQVVKNAASLRCPVLVHAEDYESCACAMKTAQEKKQDGLGAWSESRSPDYEAKAISQVSALARKYGATVYFVHIGSAAALGQIRAERAAGTSIRVETCPHYMTLTHERQDGYLAKVMPPIRTERDRMAVWESVSAGEIDALGTDHVANCLGLKLEQTGQQGVWGALAGFPGIGTSLAILASEGLNSGRITLEHMAALSSSNAAKIFSMYPAKGAIAEGSDADIVLLDTRLEKTVTSDMLGGFSDYTVYEGWKLKGWPVRTMVRGQTVFEDPDVIGRPGYGRLVPRQATA